MLSSFRSARRRSALAFLLSALALGTVALAQTAPYPTKPIRLVVPYPPGGQSDIVGRAIAQPLSEALGQPVVVDNKAGASGLIGHDFVAKAAPDGYTLLVGNSAMLAVAVTMINDLPYHPLRDFAPIIRVGGGAYVLEVNPKLPVHSVADLLALARREPGKLNIGIGGLGSLPHLLSEQVQKVAGVQWTTVNYKGGGPMLLDLLGGQIEVTVDNVSSSSEYIKAGRLRPLGGEQQDRSAARPADLRGGRPARRQRHLVARHPGTGRHAAGDRAPRERGAGRGPAPERAAAAPAHAGHRRGRRLAGRLRGLHPRREPALGHGRAADRRPHRMNRTIPPPEESRWPSAS